MNIVWSPTARRRAEAAVQRIGVDRPLGALEWYEGLIERIDLLRELPEQGRVVPEWHEAAVREVIYKPYRVIYEIFEDRLEILTLSHERDASPTDPRGGSL